MWSCDVPCACAYTVCGDQIVFRADPEEVHCLSCASQLYAGQSHVAICPPFQFWHLSYWLLSVYQYKELSAKPLRFLLNFYLVSLGLVIFGA